MGNILGDELIKIREGKFPGLSLRRVGGILHDEHGFGEYFYTQLSKIEQGSIIPSADLLNKILDAYGVPKTDRAHVMTLFTAVSAYAHMHGISSHHTSVEKAATLLYRKVKKRK